MGWVGSAPNLGALLNRRYIYFVPFGQDDPVRKPASLVADFSQVADAAQAALEGRQLQPCSPSADRVKKPVVRRNSGSPQACIYPMTRLAMSTLSFASRA